MIPVAANQLPQETLVAITGGDRSKVILNIGRRLSLELSHSRDMVKFRVHLFLQNAA